MELDHVLIAVTDLAEAAEEINARHGLASIDGGRHPGLGTANRIVPLGGAYLELIAVVDELEAVTNPLGRWVAQANAEICQPFGWAVRTHDLDGVARRLDLTISAGSRKAPSGPPLRWRMAGIEQAFAEPPLPFFLEWGPGTQHPGRTPAAHLRVSPKALGLELEGDIERIAEWLGDHELPVAIRAGKPAVAGILVTDGSHEIVLGADRL